ncbi:MAG TPA: hypothetical protein VLX92_07825 [Kofleriaceae bacterium]|nr:hypothetical protein [Kofleriaceae bacterium]
MTARAIVDRYATVGMVGGGGGTLAMAVIHGQPLLVPAILGSLFGAITGALYGILRARRS